MSSDIPLKIKQMKYNVIDLFINFGKNLKKYLEKYHRFFSYQGAHLNFDCLNHCILRKKKETE